MAMPWPEPQIKNAAGVHIFIRQNAVTNFAGKRGKSSSGLFGAGVIYYFMARLLKLGNPIL